LAANRGSAPLYLPRQRACRWRRPFQDDEATACGVVYGADTSHKVLTINTISTGKRGDASYTATLMDARGAFVTWRKLRYSLKRGTL